MYLWGTVSPATCTAKATSCVLDTDKTACTPVAGCNFTAAVAGKCTAASTTDSGSGSSGAFGLKTTLFAIFLIFFFLNKQ